MSELSDLMLKDPLSLTKDDLSEIVKYHRENRERNIAGIKIPKAKTEKIAKGSADLDDLEIDL